MPDLDDTMRDGKFDPDATAPMDDASAQPGLLPFGYLYKQTLARFERRARGQDKPVPLYLGDLSHLFGGVGLWPGLYVMVGLTAAGKTQLALQLSLDAAQRGVPSAYVGLELGRDDWVARLIGADTASPWSRLYWGLQGTTGMDDELTRAHESGDELAKLPLYLVTAQPNGFNSYDLRCRADELRKAHPDGPALLVVDYLQLMAGLDRDDTRARVGQAAYQARAIARDLDMVVLMVSSVARANYGALATGNGDDGAGLFVDDGIGRMRNPTALVGLGKESGDIEFAADAVMVMAKLGEHRDGGEHLALCVPKIRAARPGWVPLRFTGWSFERADYPQAMQGSEQRRKPDTRGLYD